MITPTELAHLASRTQAAAMEDILRRQSQHRGLRPATRKLRPPEDAVRTMQHILARQARVRRLVPAPRKPQLWPAYVCR